MEPTETPRRQATARALWAAAAPVPDLDEVRQAFAADLDHELLTRGAEIGRVAPLVVRNLAAAGIDVADRPWAGRMVAETGLRRAQEAMLLPRVLRTGIVPLRDAGLEPLLLKGPALLDRYPAPGLRGMDDVDVLVPRRARDAAVAALTAAGWREVRHDRDTGYDVPFVHDSLPGLPLELHVGLDRWWERNSRLRGHHLVARRRPIEVCGVPAFGLPAEEELVYLAAHAAKPWHVFSRLIWSVDLAVVAHGGPDWDRVDALATTLDCRTALAFGLTLAHRLGADVPAGNRAVPTRVLASGVLDQALDPLWPLEPDNDRRHRVAAALMDRRRDQLRMAVGWIGVPASRGHRTEVAAQMARGALRWTWRERGATRSS